MKRTAPLARKTPMRRAAPIKRARGKRQRADAGAESSAWKTAVAAIGICVLCGRYGVHVAHRNKGKGMGQKVPDYETAAICPDCHFEIDNGKDLTREQRRAAIDDAIVRTHSTLIRSGKLVLVG